MKTYALEEITELGKFIIVFLCIFWLCAVALIMRIILTKQGNEIPPRKKSNFARIIIFMMALVVIFIARDFGNFAKKWDMLRKLNATNKVSIWKFKYIFFKNKNVILFIHRRTRHRKNIHSEKDEFSRWLSYNLPDVVERASSEWYDVISFLLLFFYRIQTETIYKKIYFYWWNFYVFKNWHDSHFIVCKLRHHFSFVRRPFSVEKSNRRRLLVWWHFFGINKNYITWKILSKRWRWNALKYTQVI